MKRIGMLIFSIVMSFVFIIASCGCGSCDGKNKDSNLPIEEESKEESLNIILGFDKVDLQVGETVQIKYAIKNYDGNVIFKSDNEKIAEVSDKGIVKALDIGNTLITLKAGIKIKKIQVFVKAAPTYSIKNTDGEVLLIRNTEYRLMPKLQLGNTEIPTTFNFTSIDQNIVLVDNNGVVKAINEGETFIRVSCNIDNKEYFDYIKIIVNYPYYIEAEDIDINYHETKKVNYSIKQVIDNTEIQEDAEITSSNPQIIQVNNDTIKALDFGSVELTIKYSTINKKINVNVIGDYPVLKDEFNLFGHNKTIENIITCKKQKFGYNDYVTNSYLTNEVNGNKLGEGENYFVVSSKYIKTGKTEKYVAMFGGCRQDKDSLIKLKNEGYKYINFTFMLKTDSAEPLYVSIPWTSGHNHNLTQNQQEKWITEKLPIDDYINNYDLLNTIPKEDNPTKSYFMYCAIEDIINNYELIIKPIRFSK